MQESIDHKINPDLPPTISMRNRLRQAVGCLDVKLDEELARFRHLQGRDIGGRDLGRQDIGGQLAIVSADGTWEQQTQDYDADSGVVSAEFVKPVITNTTIDDDDYETIPPPMPAFATVNPSLDNMLEYKPFDLHPLEISVPFQPVELDYTPGGQIEPFRGEEYLAESEQLRQQASEAMLEGAAPLRSAIESPAPAPAVETVAATSPPQRKLNLFTPWKVGSVAAILAIAGTATYLYTNPAILSPQTAAVAPTTSVLPGTKIQSPDLAVGDFTEPTLATLTTTNLKPQTATIAAPATTAAPVTAAPVTAASTTTAAPTAIPYNPVAPQSIVPAKTTAQPKLSDSLMKNLLPQNLQQVAKQVNR